MEKQKQSSWEQVQQSSQFLTQWEKDAPEILVVLGSGLSQFLGGVEVLRSLPLAQVPCFRTSGVPGHQNELQICSVKVFLGENLVTERRIALLRGRTHLYEGYTPAQSVHNLRALLTWGIRGVVLTNAAGCLQTHWPLGSMMLITDHINMTGLSPLLGDAGAGFGQRFVDMSEPYDSEWQRCFCKRAEELGYTLHKGVYAGVLGPQYETPAEIRMLGILGASAVGMSTVHEVIAARQMKAKVAAISCLTNYAAGLKKNQTLHHDEVMEMSQRFSQGLWDLVVQTAATLTV